jgi:hypothetical protein
MRTLIRQNRDPRIDFFRGYALWCMFIDHLIKSWLRAITFREFTFCDSAELFVLLSGISAGIVYKRAWVREGRMQAWLKILRRVVAIYRAHLIMFILVLAEAGALVAWLNPASFLSVLNLETYAAHPFRAVFDGVLMRYQPKFFDILPLYVFFLLLLCLVLPLIRWPRLVLAGSVAVYLAARVLHLGLPAWAGSWYFNPFAWQIVFMIGVLSGSILKSKTYWRGWDWLAIAFSIFSLVESHAKLLVHRVPAGLLVPVEIDKSGLHPFKLLAILALAWLAWRHISPTAKWFQARWAEPFVLLGQHSLPVFVASVLFAVLGQALLYTHPGVVMQFLTQAVGSVALVAVAALSAWNSKKKPVPTMPAATPPDSRVETEPEPSLVVA